MPRLVRWARHAQLRGAHLRVPDERPRLRAALAGCWRTRATSGAADGAQRRRGRVQHLRGARERRQPALRQPRPPRAGRRRRTPACRSPSAAAWRRRTAARSPAARRGSTSSSAPTTSGRCRRCSSGPGTTRRRRSRSSSRSRSSRPPCRPGASRPTPPGSRSASAATTPARSASSRRCAAPRRTAARATSSPRSRRWWPRASSRSRCSGRTSTPTAWSSATGCAFGKLLRACGEHRGARAGALHLAAPEGLHRRRHRGDGRDAQRHAVAAHAAAVRLRPGAQGDAPVLPPRPLPRHPRPGPRRDARRRDHHRHHRRLPRRDRGRLRADPRRRARRRGSRARSPSSTPRGPARRPPTWTARCRRPSCRSATSGWSRCRTTSPGRENKRQVGRAVEVLVAEGEGRKDGATAPAVRPRAATTAWCTSRCRRRGAAARRRRDRRGHLRRPAPPGGRRRVRRRPRHPRRRRLGGPPGRASPQPAGVLLGMPSRRVRRPRAATTSRPGGCSSPPRSARTRRCSCPVPRAGRAPSSTTCGPPATTRARPAAERGSDLLVVVGDAPAVGPYPDGRVGEPAALRRAGGGRGR